MIIINEPILCYDVIFKSIFCNLEDILNKFIFDINGEKFHKITLGMNELPIQRKNEKFKRCDFIINTDKNIIINIELNHQNSKSLLVKNTSYIFELFSTYTSKSNQYIEKLKIIQININYFSKFKKYLLDYKIQNSSYGLVYFDGLKIFDLDIEKCKYLYYNNYIRKKRALKWGALFASASIEEMKPILEELLTKKEVYRFMETIKKITRYHHIVDEKEALRLDDKFRKSLYNEGIEEGKEIGFDNGKKIGFDNGKNSIIKSMINHKLDYNTILAISGKSIEEIKEIEKNM